MHIKEVIEDTKARAAKSKRRAIAVKDHGKAVVATGLDSARHVASLAARSATALAKTQRATLLDSGEPILGRVKQLRSNARTAAAQTKAELTTAVQEGIHAVKDRIAHVTSVTHKEQALEKKISRKTKKARKAASVVA